jgi:hypothetical protein
MITTIGRTRAVPVTGGEQRDLVAQRQLRSMCAFLLLAGSRRYVPPQARSWSPDLARQEAQAGTGSSYSAEELNIVQRDIGRLAQYTIEMGGSGDLLETALRIPPWEPLYRLSTDELSRMRLTTVDTLFDRDVRGRRRPPTSLATVGHRAPRATERLLLGRKPDHFSKRVEDARER